MLRFSVKDTVSRPGSSDGVVMAGGERDGGESVGEESAGVLVDGMSE